ncbi:hypothetical protein BDP27DRAFT_1371753, partial [Rhodocollybia butyracea]
MSADQGLPDWWPALPSEIIESYLALTSAADSDNLLDDFKSHKASQQDSYFIGQDTGCLPITGDIPQEYSARLIWASAVAIQRKLSPHLLAAVKNKSYRPVSEVKHIRVQFTVLTPRLVFLREHVLGRRSCPLMIESVFAACQKLSRIVRRMDKSPSDDPAWYLADHLVNHILEYVVPRFQTPDRPIPIPLDKDCRETEWLGDQEPVDDEPPGAPNSVSEEGEGEEEVEEPSDVPSESERSVYEEPLSHSRTSPVADKSSRSTRNSTARKKSQAPPAPPPKVVPAKVAPPKKAKKTPAPRPVPKASKEVKTLSIPKVPKTSRISPDVKTTETSKPKAPPAVTKLAGPPKGKSKNKVQDAKGKGKGKEVISDPVVPPSLKRKRLNDVVDEAEAESIPVPRPTKAGKKLVPVVEIPVPVASSSRLKNTAPLEPSREPTPAPVPPENLVFLVPDEDVDSLDLDSLFQRLASRSSKEFVAPGSTEYRTVIVRFERDALDLPSFEEILPRGNQKPKELFKTSMTWGVTPELDAFLDLPA